MEEVLWHFSTIAINGGTTTFWAIIMEYCYNNDDYDIMTAINKTFYDSRQSQFTVYFGIVSDIIFLHILHLLAVGQDRIG